MGKMDIARGPSSVGSLCCQSFRTLEVSLRY